MCMREYRCCLKLCYVVCYLVLCINTFSYVVGVEELWLYTIKEPAFEYSDIDSYRLFVCCEDPYGSSYSYLILRLVEVKQVSEYVPPGM